MQKQRVQIMCKNYVFKSCLCHCAFVQNNRVTENNNFYAVLFFFGFFF